MLKVLLGRDERAPGRSFLRALALDERALQRLESAIARTGAGAFQAYALDGGVRFTRSGAEPVCIEYRNDILRITPIHPAIEGAPIEVEDAIAIWGGAMRHAIRVRDVRGYARECLLDLFALPPRTWPSTPS